MDPYTGLWSRLRGFRPEELASALEQKQAVRMPLMRATVHLVSAADGLSFRPLLEPVLTRTLARTQFGRDMAGLEIEQLLEAAAGALEDQPMTNKQLSEVLARRWPDRPATSMVYAAHYLLPLVQVPPRGVWGQRGEPRWTTIQAWLGRDLAPQTSLEKLVLRYLRAFGPASVMDVQAWCGLTRLGEVVEKLRPKLRAFYNEQGRELFDEPDAPRPPAELPAPVRYLPEYDNLLISHADRTRFHADGVPPPSSGQSPFFWAVLVDGFCSAHWRLTQRGNRAELLVKPFVALSAAQRQAVEEEGERLLSFLRPDADRDIRIDSDPER